MSGKIDALGTKQAELGAKQNELTSLVKTMKQSMDAVSTSVQELKQN